MYAVFMRDERPRPKKSLKKMLDQDICPDSEYHYIEDATTKPRPPHHARKPGPFKGYNI